MGIIHITSGRLRGRKVRTPEGIETRPLLTRLRKSLADILRPRLRGARVLDLFGGSGAVSFELLSNGAASAVVVEKNPKTAELIRQNAWDLGAEEDVEVFNGDGIKAISRLAGQGEKFDIIVVAPPYGLRLQQRAIDVLGKHEMLTADGTVIVQREDREPVPEASGRLRFVRTRSYGRTAFDFYEEEGQKPVKTN
jgi:16S rRNA (guanine(966)-N(2))-methyltransferase RsmD